MAERRTLTCNEMTVTHVAVAGMLLAKSRGNSLADSGSGGGSGNEGGGGDDVDELADDGSVVKLSGSGFDLDGSATLAGVPLGAAENAPGLKPLLEVACLCNNAQIVPAASSSPSSSSSSPLLFFLFFSLFRPGES